MIVSVLPSEQSAHMLQRASTAAWQQHESNVGQVTADTVWSVRALTLRQQGLLCVTLQELFWANAVHAVGMTKCGCWLNPFDTHFILSGVNFPLVLQALAQV